MHSKPLIEWSNECPSSWIKIFPLKFLEQANIHNRLEREESQNKQRMKSEKGMRQSPFHFTCILFHIVKMCTNVTRPHRTKLKCGKLESKTLWQHCRRCSAASPCHMHCVSSHMNARIGKHSSGDDGWDKLQNMSRSDRVVRWNIF